MKATRHWLALAVALLFSWLFFKRIAGINLLLFDLALLSSLYVVDKQKLTSGAVRLFFGSTLLAAIMVAWHNSGWAVLMHHLSFLLLGGALAMPQLKNTVNIAFAGIMNIVLSIKSYAKTRNDIPSGKRPRFAKRLWYAIRIAIIPILIVAIFGTLYASSSPWFNQLWAQIQNALGNVFGDLINMISFSWLFTFVFGLFLTIYLLFAHPSDAVADAAAQQPEDLQRKRTRYRGGNMALKREYHIAVVLFAALNLLLFAQNVLDFAHVWVGFSWNGDYLKQFVHEGTYLLIFSIILSAALVLYYYRGNLNFFTQNKLLSVLATVWLFQNAILAASVAMRNFWYIQYFNLAYKRIGVFFFLLAVIYGLFSVYIKVKKRKSIYYLVRTNALAVFLIMLSISFVNWDVAIAKYNFAHAEKAYVHLSFLAELDESALPYMIHDADFLAKVQTDQDEVYGRDRYAITPADYIDIVAHKKERFLESFPKKHWLEWNYDDWRAYEMLRNESN